MKNINTTITKGLLNLEMTNIYPEEIKKLRDYFTQLIDLQIHRFKNGKIILHFDNDGNLRQIDVEYIKWRKGLDKSFGL